jgi:AcrR family transcriptional regulator
MGRPRVHNEETAEALLDAAERMIEAGGPDDLSLRRLAEQSQTTTRAVYSLFGSKDGLVAALAHRAFVMLGAGIRALPASEDPAADLVEAGVVVFRRFAIDHPSLFNLAFQHRDAIPSQVLPDLGPTQQAALAGLHQRIARLGEGDGLVDGAMSEATIGFHALCEGLAALELRGVLPAGDEERIWRHALAALVSGLNHRAPARAPGGSGNHAPQQ